MISLEENSFNISVIQQNKKQIGTLKRNNERIRVASAKNYRKRNKKYFNALTFMLIFIILFNIGAMFITNMLVMKQPDIELKEANPATANRNNFTLHQEAYRIISAFYLNMLVYAGLVFYHIFYTLKVIYTNKQLRSVAFSYIFLFIAFMFDFINDLGYMIGKWVFG